MQPKSMFIVRITVQIILKHTMSSLSFVLQILWNLKDGAEVNKNEETL